MPSYTTSLRLIQPATGEYSGTWGTQVNNGITALVDAAVAGTASITMTAANYTLSNNNGASDEARAMFLVLGGTPGAAREVIVPAVSKLYFVTNNTTGGFAQTVKTASGSGISVPNGASMTLRCDGTNVVEALNAFGSLTLNGGTANGVAYLNASKVLTTGSGLVFDGTNLGVGTSSPASRLDVTGAFGTSTTALTIYNNTTSSASNIARIDFRVNNTFGGNERAAAIWGMNPNAAGNNGGALVFGVSANGTATTPSEVARFDSSGNLGLGVTPSAWGSNRIAVQVVGASLAGVVGSNALAEVSANRFINSSGQDIYVSSTAASVYQQATGAHFWFTAPSGTAGNTISFTQAMTLDASGRLGIGVTNPSERLDISGNMQVRASGYLLFQNSDNTNYYYVQNTGATGSGNPNLIFVQGGVGERARITSGGDLLVGTTATSGGRATVSAVANYGDLATGYSLVLANSAGSGSNSNPINVGVIQFGNPSVTNADIGRLSVVQENPGGSTASSMRFFTNGGGGNAQTLERARITSGGDLLVGTTDAAATATTNGLVCSGTNPGFVISRRSTGAAQTHFEFRNGGTNVGNITSSTTTTTYATTSDRRLKDNIAPAPSASDVIDAIEIVSHDWKSAPDEHVTYGVIAQDLALVAPQAVLQGDDGDEIEKIWGVDYSKLVPMLIKEIQSLRARVAALEAQP